MGCVALMNRERCSFNLAVYVLSPDDDQNCIEMGGALGDGSKFISGTDAPNGGHVDTMCLLFLIE